ncbi:MAG: GNAT family N-acetyltransferase [Chthoniobacteraceae bacterium]
MNPAPSVAAREPIFTAQVRGGRVRVFGSIDDLPAATQARFFGTHWKDHRYLRVVEETLVADVEHACLYVTDDKDEPLELQPAFIVRQDLVLGVPASLGRLVRALRNRWPNFLRPRMLMIGCLAGEAHWLAGVRAVQALREGAELFARQRGVHLITFKEFPAHARGDFAETRRFARVPSYPGVRLPISFASFDAYLETLSKPTRKNLRRKFRDSAARGSVQLEISSEPSPAVIDEIFGLYAQVYARSEVRFERLTRDYFAAVAAGLSDRARFFLWRQEGRLVAFNLCFVHDGVLYDDYLGLDYAVAHDLHLYFLTFRDVLQWAIDHRLREYYSTPLSYEPKLHLRFSLVPLDLYVRHTSPWINPLYLRLARAMGPISGDQLLTRFPNSHELQA